MSEPLWTEEEFELVVARTKLPERSVLAARDLFVFGLPNWEVANKHQMMAQGVSRIKSRVLEERELGIVKKTPELAKALAAVRENVEVEKNKSAAKKFAKSLLGKDVKIISADKDVTYSGEIIGETASFLIQKVGKDVVLHFVNNLYNKANVGNFVDINYNEKWIGLSKTATDVKISKVVEEVSTKSSQVER